jgi:hypothetical protein
MNLKSSKIVGRTDNLFLDKFLVPHYDFDGRYLYSDQHIEQFKRLRERLPEAA